MSDNPNGITSEVDVETWSVTTKSEGGQSWVNPNENNSQNTETEVEREKRLARESQSYFNQKQNEVSKREEQLVKNFAHFAKDNESLIWTLPNESEKDKEFLEKVKKELSAITESEEQWWNIDSYIREEPVVVDPSIDETISLLEMTTPTLQTEEGKSAFKRDYEMLNPKMSHTERVKYTLEKYKETQNQTSSVQPWNFPVKPVVAPEKDPESQIEDRMKAVQEKYKPLY